MNDSSPVSEAMPFPLAMERDRAQALGPWWRCVYRRPDEPGFHFSLVLPTVVRPVDIPAMLPNGEELSVLGFFRTTEGPRAEFEVRASRIEREVAAADWLELFLDREDERVLHRKDSPTAGGPEADVLTWRAAADGVVVSRWIAIKDGGDAGGRLLVLQCRTLEHAYIAFADVFATAVATFCFARSSDSRLAEALRPLSRTTPGKFLTYYPESWLLRQKGETDGTLDLEFTHRIGQGSGLISMAVIARALENQPQAIVDAYLEELHRNALPTEPLPLVPADPHGGLERTWRAEAALAPQAESRVFVGQAPDAWFVVALTGPSSSVAPRTWAINKRTFAIIVESLTAIPPEDD